MTKLRHLAFLLPVLSAQAFAADTDPLDFDYQVVAPSTARPAMIFNDGSSTYIQPRAGQTVVADNGQASGPYIVVEGVPDVLHFTANGQMVTARWKRSNTITREPANPSGELPHGFTGFSGRIALIGEHGNLQLVRPGSVTQPLAQIVKAVAPSGWTGTAQKTIALTEETTFVTRDSENWLQALGRLLEQKGLYAEVDFARRNIALRVEPPKSIAVGVSAASTAGAGGDGADTASTAAANDQGNGDGEVGSSLLAEAFDAQAIRDTKAGTIQIRFATKPAALQVRNGEGKRLDLTWLDGDRVVAFETVDRFTLSGSGKTVEVRRTAEVRYDFAADNPAGLESVFEKDSATYLAFRNSKANVSARNENGEGSGELKDRFFKFNGISQQLTVVADGITVLVERVPEIHFYERKARVE
ncbi:pilus assembly protein PilL [Ralstonia solanacearum]|uniref:PilL-like protein n=1 Tax=Ralstonia solanacearum TaxID=305 RepID=UPI0005C64216|nr:PilL-like protein [Ralstonia solanacearum]MBB6592743.1 pilus assembly protein PilL [Ralstonia solanacearum]MBB6596965.1 pilus assembly protein PilL [Ralstonia solanacearum]MDB0541209.1 pilus assembly protein PilL [Ralstonia solanacearum]MDB0551417.1 pilus assembly protein PilL [Ralstonia solanacearum]MDB0556158.1 pilus assembly protein PilL [Ralstonia solanacearum]